MGNRNLVTFKGQAKEKEFAQTWKTNLWLPKR